MLHGLIIKIRQLYLRKIADGGLASDGYLLPVVIALGLGISIVSMMALQLVAQNSLTLNSQYYSELAVEAAQAGVAAAAKCIEAGQVDWDQNNGKPKLTPQTDCDGATVNNRVATVTSDSNVDSTYEVRGLENPYNNTTRVIMSIGAVSVKGPGGVKIESFYETVRTFGKVASASGTTSKRVDQISTGGDTTCAVAEGGAYCWGSNANSQLGAGGVGDQKIPIAVDTTIMSGQVTKVSVGTNHTCAVAKGKAYCWGNNASGQLGDNSQNTRNTPVAVKTKAGLSALSRKTVVDIQAGNQFTCALASDGTTACWGSNSNGRLGINQDSTITPYSKVPLAIYRRSSYTSSITPSGSCIWSILTWCMSYWPPTSTAPGGTVPDSPLYNKTVTGLGRPKGGTMCVTAVDSAGPITPGVGNPYCWGANIPVPQGTSYSTDTGCGTNSPPWPFTYGATNNYTLNDSAEPSLMSGGMTVTSKSMTIDGHLNALDSVGKLNYWNTGYEQVTVQSYANTSCVALIGASQQSFANMRYDTSFSIIGGASTQPYGSTIMGLATGDVGKGLVCYTTAGNPWCDRNGTSGASGQTGSGTTTPADAPVQVVLNGAAGLGGQLPITDMDIGNNHVCAIASTQVYCWGAGSSGQLGNNSFSNYSLDPVAVDAADSTMSNTVARGPTFNNSVSF